MKKRKLALKQFKKVLIRSVVFGTKSNLDFLQKLIVFPNLLKVNADTMFVDRHLQELLRNEDSPTEWIYWACILYFLNEYMKNVSKALPEEDSHSPQLHNWKMRGPEPHCVAFLDHNDVDHISLCDHAGIIL